MMPIPEIDACLKVIEELSNKCIDWYLLYLKKEDKYEKQICMLKYQKYNDLRGKYINRLEELSQHGYK